METVPATPMQSAKMTIPHADIVGTGGAPEQLSSV